MKNSKDIIGKIEPATFRLVVQFLNQLRHRVPLDIMDKRKISGRYKVSYHVSDHRYAKQQCTVISCIRCFSALLAKP